MESAGIVPSSLAGSEVGVFVGASSSDYIYRLVQDPGASDTQMMTGNTLSSTANRISPIRPERPELRGRHSLFFLARGPPKRAMQ